MLHKFQYNYHDSHLKSYILGPRKEVTLKIFLDSVWNNNIKKTVDLKFTAINNFEEVTIFLNQIKPPLFPKYFMDEIMSLQKLDKNTFLIDFAENGTIKIQTKKYLEI